MNSISLVLGEQREVLDHIERIAKVTTGSKNTQDRIESESTGDMPPMATTALWPSCINSIVEIFLFCGALLPALMVYLQHYLED